MPEMTFFLVAKVVSHNVRSCPDFVEHPTGGTGLHDAIELRALGWCVNNEGHGDLASRIANAVVDALANPAAYQALRERARRTIIESYDLRTLALPAQLKLLKEAMEPDGPYLWKRTHS